MVTDSPFTVTGAVLRKATELLGAVVGVVPPLLPVLVYVELPQATANRATMSKLMPRKKRFRDTIFQYPPLYIKIKLSYSYHYIRHKVTPLSLAHRHLEIMPVILSAAKGLARRGKRSFAALRMTARTPLKSAHGKPYLQMSHRHIAFVTIIQVYNISGGRSHERRHRIHQPDACHHHLTRIWKRRRRDSIPPCKAPGVAIN